MPADQELNGEGYEKEKPEQRVIIILGKQENPESELDDENQEVEKDEEEGNAAIRKGKLPMSELYELKPIEQTFSKMRLADELSSEIGVLSLSSPTSSPPHSQYINKNPQNQEAPVDNLEKELQYPESFDHHELLEKEVQELLICETAKDTDGKRKRQESDQLHELKSMKRILTRTEEENGNHEDKEDELKARSKGKRPMSELYELKPIVPKFSNNTEQGEPSKRLDHEFCDDVDYDFDQDLAILKSIYHYYSNTGVIPHPSCEKLLNYIDASIPNLKFHGLRLTNKIILLEHEFLTTWMLVGNYPDIIHPVYREIYYWSMWIWGDRRNYNDQVVF